MKQTEKEINEETIVKKIGIFLEKLEEKDSKNENIEKEIKEKYKRC
jgi:hypothetical protein